MAQVDPVAQQVTHANILVPWALGKWWSKAMTSLKLRAKAAPENGGFQ